jgi:hypothetical protein
MLTPNTAIRVERTTLRRLKNSEVVVRTWPNPIIPKQYFRIMDTEVPLAIGVDGHFYEQDEFEMVRTLARRSMVGTPACRSIWYGMLEHGTACRSMV